MDFAAAQLQRASGLFLRKCKFKTQYPEIAHGREVALETERPICTLIIIFGTGRRLELDAWAYHPHLGELAELAAAFPEVAIILDKIGAALN